MFCEKCGKEISDDSKFCPGCGTPQNSMYHSATSNPQSANVVVSNIANASAINMSGKYSEKSRFVALILCILFGFLGVHRFYLKKYPTGILFLFTGGLLFAGVIWDIIMLIMNNAKDGDGLPLK